MPFSGLVLNVLFFLSLDTCSCEAERNKGRVGLGWIPLLGLCDFVFWGGFFGGKPGRAHAGTHGEYSGHVLVDGQL